MDVNHLVLMANRIGEFFQSMPDREEALAGIANHVSKFWEPRMRQEMARHINTTGGAGLEPLVLAALRPVLVPEQA